MNNIDDNIPSLKIEANDDGTITLEQDWSGNVDRVAVHPVHIRHMAEKLGIVREASASEAELLRVERDRVAYLRKENDRLKRNMLRIQQHALAMQDDFRKNADWKHADLTHEMGAINTLVDLFDMAVDDFVDDYVTRDSSADGQNLNHTLSVRLDKAPENGSVQDTQKRAASASAQQSLDV